MRNLLLQGSEYDKWKQTLGKPDAELKPKGDPLRVSKLLKFWPSGDGEGSWQQILGMGTVSSLKRNMRTFP